MPRIEAEKRSGDQSLPSKAKEWTCSACGNAGCFASDSSPAFGEFANDLVFEAYAASLQKAGYEIDMYSAECDRGNHSDCPGRNRLPQNAPPPLDRCWCLCHQDANRTTRTT